MAVVDAISQIGVTEVTYYRWRKEYSKKGVPGV
jgi:transposase-like protein